MVQSSTVIDNKTRLYTSDPSALLPRIIAYTQQHALRIISLSTLSPSLEDVFLEITGGEVGSIPHDNQNQQPARRRKRGRK